MKKSTILVIFAALISWLIVDLCFRPLPKFDPYSFVFDPVNKKFGTTGHSGAVDLYHKDFAEAERWLASSRNYDESRSRPPTSESRPQPVRVIPHIVCITNEVYHTNEIFIERVRPEPPVFNPNQWYYLLTNLLPCRGITEIGLTNVHWMTLTTN